MSDYTVYDSPEQLREHLRDIDDMLADLDKTQHVLDEQRAVLVDQVNGALAIHEKQVSDYEQERDNLDGRQKQVNEFRADAEANREVLQLQLDAKLGRSKDNKADRGVESKDQGNGAGQADGVSQVTGPTTREQIDALKEQLSKPRPALNLEPPGMGTSQASAIDKDLKIMAKIKAKEQQLKEELKESQAVDGASTKVKDDWNRSKAHKH